MRKRIVPRDVQAPSLAGQDWLNLEDLVEVEVTSEDPAHPVEAALLAGGTSGWRSAGPGEQTIVAALRAATALTSHPSGVQRA